MKGKKVSKRKVETAKPYFSVYTCPLVAFICMVAYHAFLRLRFAVCQPISQVAGCTPNHTALTLNSSDCFQQAFIRQLLS